MLVRINPEGKYMDGIKSAWGPAATVDVNPVLEQIKTMHAKGHGVIGMKIYGNGDFKTPEERDKSVRFAMSKPEINAIVVGFTQPGHIDGTIERMNRILAET